MVFYTFFVFFCWKSNVGCRVDLVSVVVVLSDLVFPFAIFLLRVGVGVGCIEQNEKLGEF